MTREEAASRIKDHIEVHRYHEQNAIKILEALNMAIKALEQPEIVYCKNCIYGRCDVWLSGNGSAMGYGWCERTKSAILPNDFCSRPERRKEGERDE